MTHCMCPVTIVLHIVLGHLLFRLSLGLFSREILITCAYDVLDCVYFQGDAHAGHWQMT